MPGVGSGPSHLWPVTPSVWSLTALISAPPTLPNITLLQLAVQSLPCHASHHFELVRIHVVVAPLCPWYEVSSKSSYPAPPPSHTSARSWCFKSSQPHCTQTLLSSVTRAAGTKAEVSAGPRSLHHRNIGQGQPGQPHTVGQRSNFDVATD